MVDDSKKQLTVDYKNANFINEEEYQARKTKFYKSHMDHGKVIK